jgi:peroxiredoxin Q/BCP
MSQWIQSGSEAPDFTLSADDGSQVALRALRGSPVVLYFYPRDDTPGCTKEACAFRDQKAELSKLGAKILGVSTDDLESHQKFRHKFDLNFPLLADTDHRVAEAYGAWREKVRFGKSSLGIQRSTFLIDAEGVVRKVWNNVQVDGHDRQVIDALKELQSAATHTR